MNAIRVNKFGEPDVMKLENRPDFQVEAGQILVDIKAAGVNPVDTYIRAGTYPMKPELPFTPGMDGAGIVAAVGDTEGDISVGQRVYLAGSLTGTYASQALCSVTQAYPLPENISFKEGAGIYVPYATAWRGLFQRAKSQAGETVLVHGASGGVGIAAVQLARAAGMTVIGTVGSERGKSLVLEQGAHHVVNHYETNYTEEIIELTKGLGVNVIMEMLANINLSKDLKLLNYGGRVVIIGNRGEIEINPRDAMAKDANILGMVLLLASPADLSAIHAGLYAGLEKNILKPVVGKEFSLGEASLAHLAVMEPGAYGKIILSP
tara:strand:- start:44182 stop:45144 length:963 start_codon:yes stop_codon:yes gene_type:complete